MTHPSEPSPAPARMEPYYLAHRPNVFEAMVWNELRELRTWAGAMLIFVASVIAFSAWFGQVGADVTIGWFAKETVVLAPLVALVMGLAQNVPQNRGDPWSFLVHRPAARSTVFLARAVAGLAAYLIAIGLPVAGVIVWAAFPGHLAAPFDIRMAAPMASDVLTGVVWYFAGVLTAMRAVRWYGTRALGIVTALIVSVFTLVIPQIVWALALAVGGVLVIGAAAWGSFVAGGGYDDQPRVGRLATGLTIGLGLWVVSTIAIAIGEIALTLREPVEFPAGASYTRYAVSPQGDLLLIAHQLIRPAPGPDTSFAAGSGRTLVSVTDVGGNAVQRYADPRAADSLESSIGVDRATMNLLARREPVRKGYRNRDRIAERIAGMPELRRVWYYLYDEGLFVVYDTRSRLRIGWMGPEGYVAGDERPDTRFEGTPRPLGWSDASVASFGWGPTSGSVYMAIGGIPSGAADWGSWRSSLLVFPHDVYRVSLAPPHVEHMYAVAPGDSVLDAATSLPVASMDQQPGSRQLRVVATGRGLALLVSGTGEAQTLPHAVDPREVSLVEIFRPKLADNGAVYVRYVRDRGGDEEIVRFDSAGGVAFRHSVAAPPPGGVALRESFLSVLTASIATIVADRALRALASPDDPSRLSPGAQDGRTDWIVTIILAVLSAAAASALGRANSFSRRRLWSWTAIAFFAGPIGFLLMLGLVDWPAREPCPSCSAARVVTSERCDRCGAAWPPPALNGTEILEPALQRA